MKRTYLVTVEADLTHKQASMMLRLAGHPRFHSRVDGPLKVTVQPVKTEE
jgi:hypothetical protein